MQLLYDITTEPIAWASIYLLWLIALVAIFFAVIIGLGNPGSAYGLRKHRLAYLSLATLAAFGALSWSATGLMNRSSCVALVPHASIIEGPIRELSRGRSTQTHVRFRVQEENFNTEPALLYGCGFVRSVTDVTSLADGDYVRISFDGPRILKVWKQRP